MAWDYDPKEANAEVWPKGDYEATLESATAKTSKSNKPMLELVFTVYNGDKKKKMWVYIVRPNYVWPLKSLAKALGKLDDFEARKFDASDYINHNVLMSIDVEDSEQYGEQNKAAGFKMLTRAGSVSTPATVPPSETIKDDDIPF